jgi:hypothetical protein
VSNVPKVAQPLREESGIHAWAAWIYPAWMVSFLCQLDWVLSERFFFFFDTFDI